ncbi:transketolase [bacterium]|nr:transketolase [bacterium]NUN44313.1 transketolase [bacterium]
MKIKINETYEDILTDLVHQDNRFMALTAENRAPIRGIPDRIGSRFVDTGITEQTLIGMAAGLALRGRIPVAHALASFLTMRAFEFIRTDVGIGALPVKMVGYIPGILSDANGPTHQAIEDVSIMRTIPPVGIFCPADIDDLLIGIRTVLTDPRPFYIRYNHRPANYVHSDQFAIGKAEVIKTGSDIAICTYGALFNECLQASTILEDEGISVRLINLRTLKPIDKEALLCAMRETSLLVAVEDHFETGGLSTILSEIMVQETMTYPPLLSIAFPTWFKPGLLNDVLEHERMTGEHIAQRILTRYNQN